MKRSEAQLNGHKRQQIELQYVIWLFFVCTHCTFIWSAFFLKMIENNKQSLIIGFIKKKVWSNKILFGPTKSRILSDQCLTKTLKYFDSTVSNVTILPAIVPDLMDRHLMVVTLSTFRPWPGYCPALRWAHSSSLISVRVRGWWDLPRDGLLYGDLLGHRLWKFGGYIL